MTNEKFLVYSDEKVVLKQFDNLDLSQVKNMFEEAFFERQLYKSHVKQIKEAIIKRKLYDRIITVMPVDSKYKIIDGQHRLEALFELYKEGILKSYPLTLRIIHAKNEKEARYIYLALDSSKSLTARDVLKVFDDGTVPFFNNLREYCHHYKTQTYISYLEMLGAYNWATTNLIDIPARNKFEETVTSIENFNIERLNLFIKSMYGIYGRNTSNFHFRASIFRSLCKVFFKHFDEINFDKKWVRFLLSITTNDYLQRNSIERSQEGVKAIYQFLEKQW
jgi:hypothetical protein